MVLDLVLVGWMRFDPLVILDFVCSFLRCILGYVLLDVKYFAERKIFSSVWLHSKKYFGKYFLVFGCVSENALKNPFLSYFSHFLRIQTNIITENQDI